MTCSDVVPFCAGLLEGAAAGEEDKLFEDEEGGADVDEEVEFVAAATGARCHEGRTGAVVGAAGNWFLDEE